MATCLDYIARAGLHESPSVPHDKIAIGFKASDPDVPAPPIAGQLRTLLVSSQA